MSSAHQTRSKDANTVRPKTAKAGRKPQPKGVKGNKVTMDEDDDELTLSSAEKKQLEKLTSKKRRIEQQQAAALRSGRRKRSAEMVMEEASEDEDEGLLQQRQSKKSKKAQDIDAITADSGDGDGDSVQGGMEVEEQRGSDDAQEEEDEDAGKEKSRPKPRPAYKGTQVEDNVEENEEDKLEEGERELARSLRAPLSKKKTPASPSKDKGKATSTKSSAGDKSSQGRTKPGRQVMESVTIIKTRGGKTVGKGKEPVQRGKEPVQRGSRSSKADKPKPSWYEPLSASSGSEYGGEDGGSESKEDEREVDIDSDDDVVLVDKQSSASKKGKVGRVISLSKEKGKRNRNRSLVMALPDAVTPIRNLGTAYLKLHIALEMAWVKYTSSSHSLLIDKHEILEKIMQDVRQHRDRAGRCPSELRAAFKELGEAEDADDLRKKLSDVVWQGASQMRNDLKKKAKQVVDEAYGLAGLKAKRKQALAVWLCTSRRQALKDGGSVNVPNFIFPVVELVWVDNKNVLDEKRSVLNLRKPFQHPAVSKLIYTFWFAGAGHSELRAPRGKFSQVPDNLIALVCNTLEAALKDNLEANNALDQQFSNKIYAPKWDDHMRLLNEISTLNADGYRSIKDRIWSRVRQVTTLQVPKAILTTRCSSKIKEDENVIGGTGEDDDDAPQNLIPFDDLAVSGTNTVSDSSDAEQDQLKDEGGDHAGSSAQQNEASSSRKTGDPPAVTVMQATTEPESPVASGSGQGEHGAHA
ncbi:uncharacterized protein B0H18DRAFT_955404 [Fomitopsis serialis]|uniref:uncharacterized protein n=1 Tax=Fomitopsis serialis TaxID=139415 RepID=UPI002008C73E|nr:uncharacterized protein B0H18DRAFT_955404 [Neoantrodia serialis]KAH9924486.1 hypothetical protein B0H18DRAFT_955404 [Neoantrodia serialis]